MTNAGFEDERGSEVDDYTAEVPRVDTADPRPDTADPRPDDAEGPQPSGFGPGDVADVGDGDDAVPHVVDVAAVVAERDQYRGLAQRVQADFENYRKRTTAQTEADIDRATGRLVELAFLPILDAAEAAYLQHPDEIGPLLNLMLVELRKHGLETLDLDGRPFDPNVAEAVMHQPGAGGEVVVSEVLRSGYRWRDKTLRAAMVRTTD